MILRVLADEFRFLTFRRPSEAMQRQYPAYLAFGLIFTWLAGIGRYWDNPKAHFWQQLGLGSLIYVFLLALLLWGLLVPLRPKNWSYRNVLLFIPLTAPPAVLYAIPVERFMAAEPARTANAWFLVLVAVWRVALFFHFLRRVAGLSPVLVFVAGLLPMTLIIIALSLLNLEHVVFDLMAGIAEEDVTPNDSTYQVVLMLSLYSFLGAPILMTAFILAVVHARNKAQPGASDRGDSHDR